MPDNKYLEEYTLVFPATLLDKLGRFQGLNFELEKYLNVILDSKNHTFVKRKIAESNPEYKQLIPYAILHCNGKIFTYRRGKLLSEKRLHGNYSIGIGGHISVHDPSLFNTSYEDGLKREMNEEVYIDSNYTQKIGALLNDDSNDVGKVHFGIVHSLNLEQPLVRPKEKSINEAKFSIVEELQKDLKKFETWSQICIRNLNLLIQ